MVPSSPPSDPNPAWHSSGCSVHPLHQGGGPGPPRWWLQVLWSQPAARQPAPLGGAASPTSSVTEFIVLWTLASSPEGQVANWCAHIHASLLSPRISTTVNRTATSQGPDATVGPEWAVGTAVAPSQAPPQGLVLQAYLWGREALEIRFPAGR